MLPLQRITFKGRNVHPGYAKNKMINSIRVANQFIAMLPSMETPEQTEGYEGFYHLISIQGDVEQSTVSYIIRDHDRAKFEKLQGRNKTSGCGDQHLNMEKVRRH